MMWQPYATGVILRRMNRAAAIRCDLEPDEAHLENFISFKVSRLSQLLARGAEARYGREFDLSLRQWRVLATLGRFPGKSIVSIAARTALDKSQVSRAVGELKRRKLIEQRNDAGDRRRLILNLTKEGQALYERVLPVARKRHAQLVASLRPAELNSLEEALESLTKAAMRMLRSEKPF